MEKPSINGFLALGATARRVKKPLINGFLTFCAVAPKAKKPLIDGFLIPAWYLLAKTH